MMRLVEFGEHLVFAALLAASVIALAVGIERTIVFRRSISKTGEDFVRKFSEILRKRNMDSAGAFLKEHSGGVYSEFADFGMEHYSEGHDGLFELLQGKTIEIRIDLEKRLSILNTLGNNAPFIGLLGTVLGVIKAFNGLGTLGNTGAEVVMKSISTALFATAAGLFVAIPVVMANNYFTKNIRVIIHHLEMLTMEFMAALIKKRHRGPIPAKEVMHGLQSNK